MNSNERSHMYYVIKSQVHYVSMQMLYVFDLFLL